MHEYRSLNYLQNRHIKMISIMKMLIWLFFMILGLFFFFFFQQRLASIQQAREDEERKDREEAGKKWKEIEKAEKKRNDEINYEKMVFTYCFFLLLLYQVCFTSLPAILWQTLYVTVTYKLQCHWKENVISCRHFSSSDERRIF